MNARSKMTFVAAAALAATVCTALDASATVWWRRLPGGGCTANYGMSTMAGSLGTGGLQITGASSGVILTQATCPFINADNTLDTAVTAITVDLYAGAGAQSAGTLTAQACVYSAWTQTCGSTVSSPAIAANGHSSLSITDKSAWTGDSGLGYAYVLVRESNNSTNYVAGVYFAD